jgi:Effector-associated domain 11
MNAKSILAQWLADGDLDRTLRGLEWLQNRHHPALNTELVLQKGRFQSLQNDRDRDIVAEEHYRIELARIRMALLTMLENVPENWPPTGLENVRPTVGSTRGRSFNFKKWIAIAAGAMAFLAAVAEFSGYSLRDFFEKKASAPASQPAPEIQKPAETPAALPSQTEKSPKNQTNITVKDKAKVGTIITGDSNKIDIKQDF